MAWDVPDMGRGVVVVRVVLVLACALSLPSLAFPQSSDGQNSVFPPTCKFGTTFFKIGATPGPYWCSSENVWTALGGEGSVGPPAR